LERLKFWKPKEPAPGIEAVPVIRRFNIQPRTDVGTLGLPADPDQAARLVSLRKRREALMHDVASAEEAGQEHNRWRTEIALIDQAMAETDRDLSEIGTAVAPPGSPLPATPIAQVTCETDPAIKVQFRIGVADFHYAEEIDWAERGHQIARSELIAEQGNIDAVIPQGFPESERAALRSHLERSLFAFASDVRDRALNGQDPPSGTLADLAKPSPEFGGWLDWTGQSAIKMEQETERNRLREELDRLQAELARLIEDEAKTAERLPIARRRLLELDREIEAINQGT
jgi:hypothetical protein